MSVGSILKALLRKLTPPGDRGSLDTEYNQPNGEGTHVSAPVSQIDRAGR
jgi:hypothetical protein